MMLLPLLLSAALSSSAADVNRLRLDTVTTTPSTRWISPLL